MLPIHKGKGRKTGISSQIHQGLEKQLNDPILGFRSDKEAVDWVENNYPVTYKNLYRYMRANFGTKIKRPV